MKVNATIRKMLHYTVLEEPNRKGVLNSETNIFEDIAISDTPLVVILGSTGAGKTKLAVELCRRFNGEVVSADSMQVYEGLDIATNKVTAEESAGIPHHLIGVVSPLSFGFSVVAFRNRATNIINEIWNQRRRLPVIVGGTNYYIESLLWQRSVGVAEAESDDENFVVNAVLPFDVNAMTDEQLYEELRKIDPVTADRQHPHNRRRVIRSLQIYYQTGRTHSDWLNEQHAAPGGNILGGPLRFRRLCVIWLMCEREILKQRIHKRVDEMEERGLRREIVDYYDRNYADYRGKLEDMLECSPDAQPRGVFQSIGLKEFENFLKLDYDIRDSDAGTKCFKEGVRQLKMVTVRYANKQTRWTTNRFCRLAARDSVPIFCVDSTRPELWNDDVFVPAEDAVDAFLNGRKSNVRRYTAVDESINKPVLAKNQYCTVCERLISGFQYEIHLKSYTHRRCLQAKKQAETSEETLTSISENSGMEKCNSANEMPHDRTARS